MCNERVLVPVTYGYGGYWDWDESDFDSETEQTVPVAYGDTHDIRMWWEACLCAVSQALVGGEDWNFAPLEVLCDWFHNGYPPREIDVSHATPEILERVRFCFSGLTKAVHGLVEKYGAIMETDTPAEMLEIMCDMTVHNPRLRIKYEYKTFSISNLDDGLSIKHQL